MKFICSKKIMPFVLAATLVTTSGCLQSMMGRGTLPSPTKSDEVQFLESEEFPLVTQEQALKEYKANHSSSNQPLLK